MLPLLNDTTPLNCGPRPMLGVYLGIEVNDALEMAEQTEV
jgi:hypothetical protein